MILTEEKLIKSRELVLEKLKNLFNEKAIECHIFGSLARGNSDAYSDIDIWFTFDDKDFEEIKKNRLEYYKKIGEIIHICEPPQNAPINGVHSALIIKDGESLIMVDIYLCQLSNSFVTKESKKIFGLDLSTGDTSFNPQKIQVDENYRIDFFIGFIFNTIKKIKRKKESPYEDVVREYNNLIEKYNLKLKPLLNNYLEEIIKNVEELSNERQKQTLGVINEFSKNVFSV